jgi:hypothetical protein
VKLITLGCAGDCATVQAVGTGGNAPYSYAWENGSTNPVRQVCPASDTAYSVKVTDTGQTGEVPRPSQTATASVTASVLACDAGLACDGGPGGPLPASGRYAGTFYCPPGPDGGIIALPGPDGGLITGYLWVDLSIDPSKSTQTGTLYGKWVVLGAIAFQASLDGGFDCTTQGLRTTWDNAVWGVPGPVAPDASVPLTVIAAGPAMGAFTVSMVAGSPTTINGTLDETSSGASNCAGTYEATLQP